MYFFCVMVFMLSMKFIEFSVCGFYFSILGFWLGEYGCKERENKCMKFKKNLIFYMYEMRNVY